MLPLRLTHLRKISIKATVDARARLLTFSNDVAYRYRCPILLIYVWAFKLLSVKAVRTSPSAHAVRDSGLCRENDALLLKQSREISAGKCQHPNLRSDLEFAPIPDFSLSLSLSFLNICRLYEYSRNGFTIFSIRTITPLLYGNSFFFPTAVFPALSQC